MRKWIQALLRKPVLWASNKFTSNPDKLRVFDALTRLHDVILKDADTAKGFVLPFDHDHRFIIFSDQHKGARNGADDFRYAALTYVAALHHYHKEKYTFISLGDSEELWENLLGAVKKHNKVEFEAEKQFIENDRFVKIFGNHDLYWTNDPLAGFELEAVYGKKIPVYEGVVLQTILQDRTLNILCTHGHQGDAQSDGNWFSKFFVSRIWAPLQAYLEINTNEPSTNSYKKTLHNEMMYEWSALQPQSLLITGHTHQPVFESLTHIERLSKKLQIAVNSNEETAIQAARDEIKKYTTYEALEVFNYQDIQPSYFNTGCCCFSDGDITGIEIAEGKIRLIKWHTRDDISERTVLEEQLLAHFMPPEADIS